VSTTPELGVPLSIYIADTTNATGEEGQRVRDVIDALSAALAGPNVRLIVRNDLPTFYADLARLVLVVADTPCDFHRFACAHGCRTKSAVVCRHEAPQTLLGIDAPLILTSSRLEIRRTVLDAFDIVWRRMHEVAGFAAAHAWAASCLQLDEARPTRSEARVRGGMSGGANGAV